MNDAEKFLAEWETRFPQEECPDAGCITSINFMNIRSKISESEAKIKDLRLALEKEEFILNWLISLDIEISVTGNVGILNDGIIDPGPNPTPYKLEGERSLNNAESSCDQTEMKNMKVKDKCEESSLSENTKKKIDLDNELNSMVVETVEDRTETEGGNEISQVETSDGNIKDDRRSTNTPTANKNTESRPRVLDLSLKTSNESIETPDEPEYENVLDWLGIQSSDVETPDKGSPLSKDKRRAGGNWSMFIDEKNSENEKGKDEEEVIYDTIPSNHELKIEDVPLKPKRTPGNEKVNIYEEVHFPDEEDDRENGATTDNVTINKLYEPVEFGFKRESISTEEKEEDGEAVYVNLRELRIPNKLAPVARLETSDASDYDSDSGKNDDKLQAYRPMTEDEINNLRKWRSDEDLSQLNQDIGEFSTVLMHSIFASFCYNVEHPSVL